MRKFAQLILIIALLSGILSLAARPTRANQALAVTTALDTSFTLDTSQFNAGDLLEVSDPFYGEIELVDATTVRYRPRQAGQDYFTLTFANDSLEIAVTVLDAVAFWIEDDLYALTLIDYPTATNTYITAINDAGQSVGYWGDADDNFYALTRAPNGEFTSLEFDETVTYARAYGINANGQITGTARVGRQIVGFSLAPDADESLFFSYAGSPATSAYKINDAGQIVGRAADVNGIHAFVRQPDAEMILFDMRLANAYTWALGINNQVDVVGFYADENDQFHGFWQLPTGASAPIDMPDATLTRVYDISDRDILVGEYALDEEGGVRHSPEHLNFNPPANVTVFYAFIYIPDERIITYSLPDAQSTSAWGINNYGQIVGVYVDEAGYTHGYQLDRLTHLYVEFEPPATD